MGLEPAPGPAAPDAATPASGRRAVDHAPAPVELSIDEVVVDGVDASVASAVAAALEPELARALGDVRAPRATAIAAVDAGVLEPWEAVEPGVIAARVAAAVARAVSP